LLSAAADTQQDIAVTLKMDALMKGEAPSRNVSGIGIISFIINALQRCHCYICTEL